MFTIFCGCKVRVCVHVWMAAPFRPLSERSEQIEHVVITRIWCLCELFDAKDWILFAFLKAIFTDNHELNWFTYILWRYVETERNCLRSASGGWVMMTRRYTMQRETVKANLN